METTTNTSDRTSTYAAVEDAHRELLRYAARTATDWQRDGYGVEAAQATVDAARARYLAAFTAYANYPR